MAKVRRDFKFILKLTEREFKDLSEAIVPGRVYALTDSQKETLDKIYEKMKNCWHA